MTLSCCGGCLLFGAITGVAVAALVGFALSEFVDVAVVRTS